ncbi:MAG: noncanonical pyrimidine nucleotidase, YjjG family [Bacteroidia bacterium]|nr:noncanonical pyrimidine nucleotidase, YjjG family [Bacteroidia bacterium]
MIKYYKHILLDLDRTLWDMDKNSYETMQELFAKYISIKPEVVCSFDEFWKQYTPINDALWEGMRNGTVDKQQLRYERIKQTLIALHIDELFSANQINKIGLEYTNTAPLKTNLVSNALELLQYLKKQKYTLHIITNGFKKSQVTKLKQCNIAHYFKHIITSEDLGVSKPHLRFFTATLNLIKANANECLVIGDDLAIDCEGAANAGIDSVWFDYLETNKHIEYTTIKRITHLSELIVSPNLS